jgi:hypothetical protein
VGTSKRVASRASEALRNSKTPTRIKSVAASDLAQRKSAPKKTKGK